MKPIKITGWMCRVCNCTQEDCRQCIERTGKPCHWVAEDLCSACIRVGVNKRCPAERCHKSQHTLFQSSFEFCPYCATVLIDSKKVVE